MRTAMLAAALALVCSATFGQDTDLFEDRPALSPAEEPARAYAKCDDIRAQIDGLPELEDRIDLSVDGELTAVRTDGALWYLTMCRDVMILCVTYESNGMKNGERVLMKGAFSRRSPDHVMLDPCLASRPADGE